MRHQQGFTLAEMLAAMTVSGFLLTVAVPSYRDVVLNAHRDSAITNLLYAIQLARSEANLRPSYVTVCPSADGRTCANATADWSKGWIVYVNRDRLFSGVEPDDDEPVLQVLHNPAADVRVTSSSRVAFTFRPFDLNSDNGTITACDSRSAQKPRARRAVIVSVTGRPRVADRKTDGSDLDCS